MCAYGAPGVVTPPAMPYRVSLIFLVAVLAGLGAQAVQAKVHQQPDVVQKASKPGNASELWDDSAANNFIGVAVSERVNTLAASGDERLLAMSTVTFLPHPGGTAKSDAWFLVTPDEGVAFGLADAGGGTSDAYAKELMQQSEVLSSKHMCWESMSTRELLREAHAQTKTKGSSTATMGMICGNRLQIAALGDAGVVVVRDGKVVLVTASQQHGFQQPLQLGKPDNGVDADDALFYDLTVQRGDLVVAATDGLWDNVFEHEVLAFVAEAQKSRKGPRALAKMLAVLAQRRGADGSATTPVAVDAKAAGRQWKGGRKDDITVVAIYVASGEDVQDGEVVDHCAKQKVCGDAGTCERMVIGYKCKCDAGYEAKLVDGHETCVDVDECADESLCRGGKCRNTVGSYTCTCRKDQLFVPGLGRCVSPAAAMQVFDIVGKVGWEVLNGNFEAGAKAAIKGARQVDLCGLGQQAYCK